MAAPYGTPEDFGGTIASNAFGWNTGIRTVSMYDAIVMLSNRSEEVVGLKLLEECGAESFDNGKSISPEWMQRSLPSINTSNAYPPAADYTFTDPNVPTRKQQVVQLMFRNMQVAGEALVDAYFKPVGDIKDDQIKTFAEALIRDKEYALWNESLVNTNEVTARHFRGVLESIRNDTNESTAAALGFGGSDLADATIGPKIFKNGLLNGVYQDNFWPTDVILPFEQQTKFDTLAFGNTVEIPAKEGERVSYTRRLLTPFGPVRLHMSRADYLASSTMVALATKWWKIFYYRPHWMEEPAKDGDRWRSVLGVQWAPIDLAGGKAGFTVTTLAT